MKVKFKIDPKVEAESIPNLVELAGEWVLTPSLRNKYAKLSNKELYGEVKKFHKGNKERFDKIKNFYKNYWESVEEIYIKELENITWHKLKQNKYCLIKIYHLK